ncbi:MAG TPA: YebC/PmpR family DNA-binding transcriptional regulator [Gammaproteobacteria bacterium]|nr:YebC/PmpR family DNA-binding transcriptional regulator [Gammaproteobacteria bacterium]
MAGHSKWANIKHKKATQDAKRGKVFTKLIREITVAAKMGGGEPADNPRLRAAVDKALSANMTKDTIQRAIDRGAGGGDNDNVEELTYEGYGPGGVAVLVEVMTDNKNRTVAEVRHAFSKCGGNLGTDGSVAYLFTKRGQILIENADEDVVMEAALEAGAEDVIGQDDASIDVATTQNDVVEVKEALVAVGIEVLSAEVALVPSTTAELDSDNAPKVIRLIDMLEDLDDVQNVYTNANFTNELLESLG